MTVEIVFGATAISLLTFVSWFLCYFRRSASARSSSLPASLKGIHPGLQQIFDGQRTAKICGSENYASVISAPGAFETASTAVLFVPGMGGQAAQFFEQAPLFVSNGPLASVAVGFFVSWPGHGPNVDRFESSQASPDALHAFVEGFYEWALSHFPLPRQRDVKVILVAHSYGCAVSLRVLPSMRQTSSVLYLAPPVHADGGVKPLRFVLLRAPEWLVDTLRAWDRRPRGGGGALSTPSIRRMVGSNVSEDMARLQLVWNGETPTSVVQAFGSQSRVPDEAEYCSRIRAAGIPFTILCGEHDKLTPPGFADGLQCRTGETTRVCVLTGGVGHQVMYEAAARVNSEIVGAVRK